MNIQDLGYVFQWWLIWLLLGLAALPLTTIIFANFFDHGYIFAKILGTLFLSYTAWLLSSLGLLPFNTTSLFLIWFIFVAFNIVIAYTTRYKKENTIQSSWNLKIFVVEEMLFLVGLTFWSFVKAHEPSIHGLEKFMDYGFINSILRTDFFPPKDLWMSPLSINYYYFGHLTAAVLTKISGISPHITYNLVLATIFGLTLSASFSLGANLHHFFQLNARRYTLLSGFLSAFLVTLGGNLQTIYAFFQNYPNPESPVPFWTLPLQLNFSGYWYPNATRFIPLTIHEFPIYSFVVSDLHGHVLNIPFVLLFIALLISIFHSSIIHTTYYILLGILIAVFLMTNVLDGPIYLLIISVVLLIRNFKQTPRLSSSILHTTYYILPIAVLAIIFSLPFWLNFTPFAQGVGILCAPNFLTNLGKVGPFLFETDHCARSPLWMLIILWGFPFFILSGFLIYVLKLKSPFHLLSSIFKKPSSIFHHPLSATDLLVLALVMASTLLIIIPEFFYAKDIYPAHYRANTVFKFGYQAFIILGLSSGYMITRLISILKTRFSILHTTYYILLATFFFLVAIYPYLAINSYYNGLKNYQGLDGFSYFQDSYPSDYQAILWIRENIQGQPIILEAQGDSYTDFARVSANTGLPTVIGWPVHEWLWRGSYDEAGSRSTDVTTLYENQDVMATQQLLKKYNVSYIFIGALERQKYSNLNEEKFQSLGKLIFANGVTRIYQINR